MIALLSWTGGWGSEGDPISLHGKALTTWDLQLPEPPPSATFGASLKERSGPPTSPLSGLSLEPQPGSWLGKGTSSESGLSEQLLHPAPKGLESDRPCPQEMRCLGQSDGVV